MRSNRAQVVWKLNGNVLGEAAHFLPLGESGLLVYSAGPQSQGRYECWALEAAAGKNFTRLVAAYELRLDLPEKSETSTSQTDTTKPPRGNKSKHNAGLTPTTLAAVLLPPLTRPVTTASVLLSVKSQPEPLPPEEKSKSPQQPKTGDPSAEYLQHDNSGALLFLFLLFFLLFLVGLMYNCYKQYLPAPCLKLRAALLGSNKKPQQEYVACESGLIDGPAEKCDRTETLQHNGALRDTGYETEPECGNGKLTQNGLGGADSATKQGPFDVDCEAQPIEYADADAS